MTAATLKSWRTAERTSDMSDTAPLALGGAVLGVVVAIICALVDMLVLIGALNVTGVSASGNPWPDFGIAAIALFAVVVSIGMGRWLYGLRRWIGHNADPMDHDTAMRKRRAFAAGSMVAYVLVTPWVWVLMLALALSP